MVRDSQVDATINDSFFLSKPTKINLTVNKTYFNMNTNMNQNNDFTFLQPLVAERGSSYYFKSSRPKINLRSQPYTTLTSSLSTLKSQENTNGKASSVSLNNSYNNNAVLARLSSISSTFKSIFVRPKQGKSIDVSSLFNKNKKNTNTPTSTNSNSPEQQQELRVNQSVNDYLVKLCSKQDAHDSSYLTERIKKISKELDQTSSSNSTTLTKMHSQESTQITKWTCLVCLSKHANDVRICSICGSSKAQSHSAAASSYGGSSASSVLNETSSTMRAFNMKSQTSHNKTSLLNFNTKNLFDLPLTNSQSTLDSPSSSQKSHSRLKTWTCQFCNFANDSLKVVCMNCRSNKSTAKIDLREASKRNRGELSPISSNSSYASSVLGDDALSSVITKRLKNNDSQVCPTCTHKETLSSISQKQQPQVNLTLFSTDSTTPIKPNFELHAPKDTQKPKEPSERSVTNDVTVPLSALFNNTSTWSCTMCLASNPNEKTTCACCSTPKTGATTIKNVSEEIPTSGNATLSSVPLSALFKDTSKWSCSTCLASNSNETSTCACCQTPKAGAIKSSNEESKKTDSFENNKLQFPAGFSAKSTPSTTNFSFGKPVDASSSAKISFSSSGFSLGSKPSDDKSSNEASKMTFGTTQSASFSFAAPKPLETDYNKKVEELTQPSFGMATSNFSLATTKQSDSKPIEDSSKLTFGTSSSTFSFGASKTAENINKPTEESSKSLFSFGAKPSDSTPTKTFSFGSSKPNENQTVNTTESTKPTFSFGSSTATTTSTDSSSVKPLFAFGSQQTTVTSTTTTAPTFTTNSIFSSSAPTTTSTTQSNGLFSNTITSTQATSSTPIFGLQTKVTTNAPSTTTTTSQSSGLFGSSNTSGLFGSASKPTENKPLFGGLVPSSSGSNAPLFGSTNTLTSSNPSPFGQSIGSSSVQTVTTAPVFSFGTSNTTTNTTNAPSTTTSSTSLFGVAPFSFSQQPASSQSNTSNSFSFAATSQPTSQAATSGFTFGNNNNNNNSQQQTATTNATPAFNFGTASTSSTNNSAFVFGQSQDLQSNPQKRINTDPPTTFNFSSNPTFNFTSTPAVGNTLSNGAAPFVFGGGGVSTDGSATPTSQVGTPRAIKKGARRLPGRR